MELTIEQALKRGVSAHREGNLEEADLLYTAILRSKPQHSDANHNMGVLAVSVGKVSEALPFFKVALEANPKVEQYWLSYLDALMQLGLTDDARSLLEQGKTYGLNGARVAHLETHLHTTINPVKAKPSEGEIDKLVFLY